MTTSVRMSDLHGSDNELASSKAGVNALRARFERIGSDDNIAASSSSAKFPPPRGPSTPPARRTPGPARPPPPRPLEKPRRLSDHISSEIPDPVQRSVTPTAGVQASLSQHPLAKSKSKSVGDLKAVKLEREPPANGSAAPAEISEGTDGTTKKTKKGKNKGKSKDHGGEEAGKKFPKFRSKGKYSELQHSPPKSSPDLSKVKKPSTSASNQSSPHASPKKHAPPSPPSSSEADSSSKEGTPTAGRRRKSSNGGKKEAVKKTESSQGELASARESKIDKKLLRKSKSNFTGGSVYAEGDMFGASPHSSPGVGRRRREGGEPAQTEVNEEAKRIREAVVVGAGS